MFIVHITYLKIISKSFLDKYNYIIIDKNGDSMSDVAERLLQDKRFLKGVAAELAKDPNLQLLILESVIKNVATKDDIRELKEEIRENRRYTDVRVSDLDKRIESLDKRFDSLDKRIDSLDKRIDSLDKRISLLQWIVLLGFSVFSVILSILTFMISTLVFR